MPDPEQSALAVLESQEITETPAPERSTGDVPESTRRQENRKGLLDLFVKSGDMDQKTADEVDKSKTDAEKPDTRLNTAGREIGKDGKFKTKEKVEEPQQETPAPEVPPQVAPEIVLPDADEFAKLTAVLERYKGTKADLDLLANGDVDKIAHARHLQKIQTDIDNNETKSKEERVELESLRAEVAKLTAQKPVEPATEATAKAEVEFNLDEATKPLSDYLMETLGEESVEPVKQVFKNILDHVQKGRDERPANSEALNEIIEVVKSQSLHIFDAHFQNAVLVLAQEYPQLSDSKLRTAVRERALKDEKDYPDVLSRVRESAKIEVAPIIAKENADYHAKHRKARVEGVADVTPGVGPPSASKPTRREMAMQSMRHMDTENAQYDPKKAKEITDRMAAATRP